ncbi:MAG: hypothetical protein ACPGU5_02245 [Lishizhenia sp.]
MKSKIASLLLLIIAFGCTEKTEKQSIPFQNRLVADECVGYVNLDVLEQQISTSFLMNKVPMLSMFNLKNMRRKFGLETEQLFFSANLQNRTARAFIKVSDRDLLDQNLELLAKQNSLAKDSAEQYLVYSYPEKSFNAVRIDSVLLLTYALDIKEEMNVFQNHTVLDSAWLDVLTKQGKPFFAKIKNQDLVNYSVNQVSTTLDIDSVFSFSFLVNKSDKFPFTIKSNFNSLSSKQSNLFLDLTLENQTLTTHKYWSKFIADWGRKISFPAEEFLKAWQGELHYAQGGKAFEKEIEIATVLDENFNVIERTKKITKEVEALQLMLTLDKVKKEILFEEMKKSGFLKQNAERYNFFIAPSLRTFQKNNHYYFYAGSALPKLKKSEDKRLLYFKNTSGTYTLIFAKDKGENLLLELRFKPNLDAGFLL